MSCKNECKTTDIWHCHGDHIENRKPNESAVVLSPTECEEYIQPSIISIVEYFNDYLAASLRLSPITTILDIDSIYIFSRY